MDKYLKRLIEQVFDEEFAPAPKLGDIDPTEEDDKDRPGMERRPKSGMDTSQFKKIMWAESMYDDKRPESENLAWNAIIRAKTDKEKPRLYVSTAIIPTFITHANDYLNVYETWIFSDTPGKSKQIHHKNKRAAIKAHKYIVDNLREKFKDHPDLVKEEKEGHQEPSKEKIIEKFRLDPDDIGVRSRGWSIVGVGEDEGALEAGAGTGDLCIHTRDNGIGEVDEQAMERPNFIGTADDEYDSTYLYYYFRPLQEEEPIEEACAISGGGAGMASSGQVSATAAGSGWADHNSEHDLMWSGDRPEKSKKKKV